MTQNVFGNNSRRKLDFKIRVVGEAFNQVRVNGLPAKFELFNQEGWSQKWHFLRYRKKWPWPIFGDHATMTIFAVSQKWPWSVFGDQPSWLKSSIIARRPFTCTHVSCTSLRKKTGCRRPTRQETELQFFEIEKRMRLAKEALHCLKFNTSS